jgi:hypothetical protein
MSNETEDWPPAGLTNDQLTPAETKDLVEYYKFEKSHAVDNEKMIYEITKYNFIAFGAVFLVTNSSFIYRTMNPKHLVLASCLIVTVISLSASVMVLYFYKYLVASRQKYRIIEKALWRRHPLLYVEWKYGREGVTKSYAAAARVGPIEFITHGYVLNWVNLIPFLVALSLGLLVLTGAVNVPPRALN